jgi:hypothetical protein
MKMTVTAAAAAMLLSGCGVHKVVTVPAKGVYHTANFAGKAVVGTTKFAGKTVYGTTKFVGKSAITTGKGVYYVGMVPVKITDKALDTTAKVLSITTQTVDLAGRVMTVTREIQATRLDAELKALKTAKNVISVFVDAVG